MSKAALKFPSGEFCQKRISNDFAELVSHDITIIIIIIIMTITIIITITIVIIMTVTTITHL